MARHSQGSLRLPSAPLMGNPLAQQQPLSPHPAYPQPPPQRSSELYDAALLRAGVHPHSSLPAGLGSLSLEGARASQQQALLTQQLLQQQALAQHGAQVSSYGGLHQLGSGEQLHLSRGLHLSQGSTPFPPDGMPFIHLLCTFLWHGQPRLTQHEDTQLIEPTHLADSHIHSLYTLQPFKSGPRLAVWHGLPPGSIRKADVSR